ncbi:MAG: hypothetical protein KDD69_12265 [Bdellovibrionales bacterium]|nr:hypothetical protein [Bdellovibrionales bacterium]
MIRYLNQEQAATLAAIATAAAAKKGRQFYDWRNSPTVNEAGGWSHTTGWGDSATSVEISPQDAAKIFEAKLNGAYGERLLLSVAYAVAAVAAGKKVAILQIKEEAGTPFDPQGWLVLSIENHPFFHLAPWDLPTAELEAEGLVNVIHKASPEADLMAWKPEIGSDGKPKEFGLLLAWIVEGLAK